MPGQNFAGARQFSETVVFTRGLATGGSGVAPPPVTTPAVPASATSVTNSTGYDINVYASASGGSISAVQIGATVLPGTVANGTMGDFYLANGQAIKITYTGTLTWAWLAI